MITEFTPISALIGGTMIGLASVILMGSFGRIFGATGILAGLFAPENRRDFAWRATLVAGMVCAPLAYRLAVGDWAPMAVERPLAWLAVGGLIVGFGVAFGGGCTSGHGVCGLARFSRRSLVATVTFMAMTALTVYVTRHILGAA